jgi:hypothetical protein
MMFYRQPILRIAENAVSFDSVRTGFSENRDAEGGFSGYAWRTNSNRIHANDRPGSMETWTETAV